MGLFTRRPPAAAVQAAGQVALATSNGYRWGTGYGRMAPADFAPPSGIWSREAAMSVPAISRARDLICSAVGALPLALWTVRFDPATGADVEQRNPPAGWMGRPDPNRTRQWLLAWTVDDLFFHGRAYWKITNRYTTTYPASFTLMSAADVQIHDNGRITWIGHDVAPADVVEFLSPLDGILYQGARAITTALNLDAAAERFSTAEVPAGWLEQTENSEPLTADELADIADTFSTARLTRTTAALNPYLRYRESGMDPSRLQLVEARLHQRGDLANVANIPPYFVGASAGHGMTYFNAAQAKQDLIDFGAMPYIGAVEQTLSGPNVTPNGQAVRLDLNAWLRNPFTPNDDASPNDMQIAFDPAAAARDSGASPGRPRQVDGLNEG